MSKTQREAVSDRLAAELATVRAQLDESRAVVQAARHLIHTEHGQQQAFDALVAAVDVIHDGGEGGL